MAMEFKTALSHYKDGTANEEERSFIEEELEKAQLIAEWMRNGSILRSSKRYPVRR